MAIGELQREALTTLPGLERREASRGAGGEPGGATAQSAGLRTAGDRA